MEELMLKKLTKAPTNSSCMSLALYGNNCGGSHGEVECPSFIDHNEGYQQAILEQAYVIGTNYQISQGNQYRNSLYFNQGNYQGYNASSNWCFTNPQGSWGTQPNSTQVYKMNFVPKGPDRFYCQQGNFRGGNGNNQRRPKRTQPRLNLEIIKPTMKEFLTKWMIDSETHIKATKVVIKTMR